MRPERQLALRIFDHVSCSIGKGILIFCALHLIFGVQNAVLSFMHWYSFPTFVLICLALGEILNLAIWTIKRI